MTKILIKNLPMIKYVDVELKKLNIVTGLDERCISDFKTIITWCMTVDNSIIRSSYDGYEHVKRAVKSEERWLGIYTDNFSLNAEIKWTSDVTQISYKKGKGSIKINTIPTIGERKFLRLSSNNTINPQDSKIDVHLLVNKMSDKDIKILSTNNPFFLYRINSCIMHSIVKDEMPEHERTTLQCRDAVLDPKDVLIMQAENGCITCIQRADGTIGYNFLDNEIKDMMEDPRVMLKYYKDPE